ncbi:metal ABC transporter solute-binding protein, Zn/Mn family [Microbacterium sp. P01]|uniref:metal ABC transporter solute-binding protein, Zn/Mn family n=1 Tax=Microbacterium sp. P01 TaxID=3366261 RepID=UPI00366DDB79
MTNSQRSLRRLIPVVATAAASALLLAGCASGAAGSGAASDDGKIRVVASTDVYGQIAEAIGGDHVDVTSVIASASQDPHEFEATASDQLAVQRAQLLIENGGGYDSFMDTLVEGSGSTAPLITAAELSPAWPSDSEDHAHTEGADDDHGHIEGFNEHVWYDPTTISAVADAIASELTTLVPEAAADITANVATFQSGLDGIEGEVAALKSAHGDTEVFATEPVPMYLAAAAGMTSVTPGAFSEAVEEGQDVAPAVLLESLNVIKAGGLVAVLANAQTGGPETQQVIAQADGQGIPVLEFTETLPEDTTYIQWMTDNVALLASALDG